MALVQCTCPECGELVPVDPTRNRVYCMYCGSPMEVADLRTDGARSLEGVFDPDAITISAPLGRGSPIPVFVDGEVFTTVNRGEVTLFDIPPGRHTMWAKVGVEGFRKAEFDVAPGDRYQIEHRGFRGYAIVKL